MSDKEILSAVRYVTRMKPEFRLSEIRQYLKEDASISDIEAAVRPHAFDLGLKLADEKDDIVITRAPKAVSLVLPEPLQVPGEVPMRIQKLVEAYIENKAGKNWDDPETLDSMRTAIIAQKDEYWKEGTDKKVTYDKAFSVAGYLAYQFPVYFIQTQHILADMAAKGLLKDRMKILDAGTGPGTVPLAFIDLFKNTGVEAQIHSIERFEENIEAFRFMLKGFAFPSIKVMDPIKVDLRGLKIEDIPANIDLMIFSNVLNELSRMPIKGRADIVKTMSERLSHDGSILIVEPADKVNSIEMRKTVRLLVDEGLEIYSPCSFIWCVRCSPVSCWSFEQKDDIKPTRLMEKLGPGDESYRFVNKDIKYSFAILRKDGLSGKKFRVEKGAKASRLSKLGMHTGKRINIFASKMSGNLGTEKEHVYKLCDGTSVKPTYAIIPFYNITPDNEALVKAVYGEVLEIKDILVRYNKETDAFNLQAGKSTSVKIMS